MGDRSAYDPDSAEDRLVANELSGTPIEDLQLSTRAYNCLKKAGIDTVGELTELTETDLRNVRNLGAKSLDEINETLRRLAVDERAFLADVDQIRGAPVPLTRTQAKRARRAVIGEAVLDVARARVGQALALQTVHEEVIDRLEFVPEEDEVRESLRLHVRSTECFVKVARDAYAWAPDGQIPYPPAPPHVTDMIDRRWRGETLDEIGAAHGKTRERIRQLLKRYGGPTGEQVRDRRAQIASDAERARQLAVAADIRGVLDGHGPATVAEMAEATGRDAEDVSRCWPPDLAHLLLRPGTNENRWSDEEVLDAIRDAALYEFPLTTNAYAELHSQGQIRGPSLPRIWQRFGSWTAACEAAGVVAGKTMRTNYQSRWTDDDLLQIVRRYLLDPNTPNSAHRFDEWKRAAAPDGPSFQTLRNRFGSWTDVKRRAMAREDGAT